jgi:hypothetical protein
MVPGNLFIGIHTKFSFDLSSKENEKGEPLTEAEVIDIRNKSAATMLPV